MQRRAKRRRSCLKVETLRPEERRMFDFYEDEVVMILLLFKDVSL